MIKERSEVLFYRVSEIHARADFINTEVIRRLGDLYTFKCGTLVRS